MLRVVVTPIAILAIFLIYTIHSQDVSTRELHEYNHEITIYSRSRCAYCTKAVELLEQKKLRFYEIDITWDIEQQTKLAQQTGSHTFPLIFIDDTYIGGCTELIQLSDSGELDEMLK